MSLPVNILDLINQRVVESSRIEYKTDWNPEDIVHSITAFANDFDNLGGGYIVIGVEEKNGRPAFPLKGINPESIDRIEKDILNKCNLIEPRYIPVVVSETVNDVDILVFWIPGGENRPYKCPDQIYSEKIRSKSPKSYYIRKASNTVKANYLEERELIGLTRNIPFDDRINFGAQVSDMRSSLISEYLHSVGSELYEGSLQRSIEDVGADMQLVRGPIEYRKPVNVGLLFFNERPDSFFPYTRIEVVDKPDPTGIGMRERIFSGPLDKQLRDSLSYIRNYCISEYVTKVPDQAEAVRVFNWPYRAVEEALCNAVYHKSYQIHEPITVTITPKSMEILSLPGPDRSITDENIEKKIFISSRYRNRRIGDFLKELKMVEGRNTGIPLMLKEMQDNGSDSPIFITDGDRSFFRVIFPIHPFFLKDPNTFEQKSKSTEQPGKRRKKEETKALVVSVLRQEESLSISEIARTLGYAGPNITLREIVNEMLKDGIIEYLYPDKPTSRNQKIRLRG